MSFVSRMTGAVLASALLVGSLAAPAAAVAPAAKKIQVGVGTSANGYVMAGEPTTIATNQRAKVYLKKGGKWRLIGKTTKNRAVSYSFAEPGVQSIRVRYGRGYKKSKVVKAAVYANYRFSAADRPVDFGGTVQLASSEIKLNGRSVSAEDGCVLLTLGVASDTPDRRAPSPELPLNVSVLSTGAPAWSASQVTTATWWPNIPVGGDVIIESDPTRLRYTALQWTCLDKPNFYGYVRF